MIKHGEIWPLSRTMWVAEIYDPKVFQRLSKLSYTTKRFTAGVNHYRRQVGFPAIKRRSICEILGIPCEKNINRVAAGKLAAESHPVNRGKQ